MAYYKWVKRNARGYEGQAEVLVARRNLIQLTDEMSQCGMDFVSIRSFRHI